MKKRKFKFKSACPQCKSNGKDLSEDNLANYNDGYVKCFACNYYAYLNNAQYNDQNDIEMNSELSIIGEYETISQWGIRKETCEFCDYRIQHVNESEEIHISTYYNLDYSIDVKYRMPPKADGSKLFNWPFGRSQTGNMYMLHKCLDYNKPLVIVEGEKDCLTLWELGIQNCSLHSGATSAEISIINDMNYINKFPEVILALDNDQVGKEWTQRIIPLLSHKLVKCVDFKTFKDSNEVFITDKELLRQFIENAEEIIPTGVVYGNQLDYKELWKKPEEGLKLPWPMLNKEMYGLHYNTFTLLLGGAKIGKSSVLRELVYHLRTQYPHLKIANFFYEEKREVSAMSYLAIDKKIPLGQLIINPDLISKEDREEATNRLLNTSNMMFFDKNFKKDSETFLNTIEYLVAVKKFDVIVLDHISYIIGRSVLSKHGERRDIDDFLYKLEDFKNKYKVILITSCHVTDSPDKKKGWDQGAIPSLYQGRGSRALATVPDNIIGVSRNMTNQHACDQLQLHLLANRWHGKIGPMDTLVYLDKQGRLE